MGGGAGGDEQPAARGRVRAGYRVRRRAHSGASWSRGSGRAGRARDPWPGRPRSPPAPPALAWVSAAHPCCSAHAAEPGTAPRPFPLPDPPPGDSFSPSLASLPGRKGLGRKHVSALPSGRFGISASRSHWLGSGAEGAGSPCLVSPD